MSVEALKSLEKKIIIYPNAYFDGYNPELFYLKIDGAVARSPLFDYTLANILFSYLKGDTIQECVDAWYSCCEFENHEVCFDGVINNAKNSIFELKQREVGCDVVLADFLEKSFFTKRYFYTMNHPYAEVMNNITSQIFNALDCGEYKQSEVELFSHAIIPMINSVKKVFNFSENNYFLVKNQIHSTNKVVENFYNWFSLYSRSQLEIGLKEQLDCKPILKKILMINN